MHKKKAMDFKVTIQSNQVAQQTFRRFPTHRGHHRELVRETWLFPLMPPGLYV